MHDCVEQAVLAERVGFDRVWSVEHHCLKWYAHMSAPETFLAFVAAKTERIRIGHGVVCLPFRMNHPVKVAERVAMLDILSKGRVDFGVGKGGTEQEARRVPDPDGGDPRDARGERADDPAHVARGGVLAQERADRHPAAADHPEALSAAAPADVSRLHAREHAQPGRRVGARRARARLRRARGHRAEEPRVPRGGEAAHADLTDSRAAGRAPLRALPRDRARRRREGARDRRTAASASSPRRSGTGTTRARARRRRAPRSPT